jgi:hypothetical protein
MCGCLIASNKISIKDVGTIKKIENTDNLEFTQVNQIRLYLKLKPEGIKEDNS